ncbi:unnamed protein product [Penicillium camemberti]|uniref:Str. FM013 n=1 Tax=Penicillium camemberti (strain FM 013) TaxID=1429867 RepID=A0A0G4PUP0_PENC3|nr:unnamed protein product [Penicillium camemberti]
MLDLLLSPLLKAEETMAADRAVAECFADFEPSCPVEGL